MPGLGVDEEQYFRHEAKRGENLWPRVKGRGPSGPRQLYFSYSKTYMKAEYPVYCIRSGDYKERFVIKGIGYFPNSLGARSGEVKIGDSSKAGLIRRSIRFVGDLKGVTVKNLYIDTVRSADCICHKNLAMSLWKGTGAHKGIIIWLLSFSSYFSCPLHVSVQSYRAGASVSSCGLRR